MQFFCAAHGAVRSVVLAEFFAAVIFAWCVSVYIYFVLLVGITIGRVSAFGAACVALCRAPVSLDEPDARERNSRTPPKS